MSAPIRTADPRSWRPQAFGPRRAQEIADPVIEPLWDGDRVVVHASTAGVTILDGDGAEVDALPEVTTAVADALMAGSVAIDGYLTPQAARTSEGAILGEVAVPGSREMTAQIFIGRGRDRRRELAESEAPVVRPGDPLVPSTTSPSSTSRSSSASASWRARSTRISWSAWAPTCGRRSIPGSARGERRGSAPWPTRRPTAGTVPASPTMPGRPLASPGADRRIVARIAARVVARLASAASRRMAGDGRV